MCSGVTAGCYRSAAPKEPIHGASRRRTSSASRATASCFERALRPLTRVTSRARRPNAEASTTHTSSFARMMQRCAMQVILERSAENLGSEERAIFDAHRLMLNDPDLWSLVKVKIFTGNLSAESAWDEAIFFYANQLKSINDPYLQARALDIQDIGSQVLRRLLGMPDVSLESLPGPVIVLAQDLFPSDTIRLDRSKLLGFCTCDGGTLSHTAILARALGLPAVIGIGPKLKDLQNGIQLIMNGTTGEVIYDPDDATLKEFRLLQIQKTGNPKLVKTNITNLSMLILKLTQPDGCLQGQTGGIVINFAILFKTRQ